MSVELINLLERAQEAHEKEQYLSEVDFLNQAFSLSTSEIARAAIMEKIGNSFYMLDRNEEAKKNYLLALKTVSNVSNDEALSLVCSINNRLAAVLFDEGDYRGALSCKLIASQCIDRLVNEDAFLLLTAIGVNYEKIEQYKEAILFYQRALGTPNIENNDIAMVNSFIGQCYDKITDREKAFEYFQKTFDIDPDYENGWQVIYRFAELAYEFGNYELSQKYFLKTVLKIPSSEKKYFKACKKYLGYNYLANGNYDNAIAEFKNILALKPDSAWRGIAYTGIAQANFSMGNSEATVHTALKALSEEVGAEAKERIYFMLAKTHLLRREKAMANTYYEKLYQLNPLSEYVEQLHNLNKGFKKGKKDKKDKEGADLK
jgi:tetratricopeptide (TPR) repeat protein